MYLTKKLQFHTLFFIIFLGLISSSMALEILYESKPDWWDEIQVNTIIDKDYNKSYYKTMLDLNYSGENIDEWYIIGPFDNNNNKPFTKKYAPEKNFSVNKKKEFNGLKGKKIKWTPWRKGTKCPVDEMQKIEHSVFFLYSFFKAPKTGKYTVIFTSDDGAGIWINKKQVFLETPPQKMNFMTPHHFEVDMNKGKNKVFIKLENKTSSWGLNMIISPYPYEYSILKTKILLFNKSPKFKPSYKSKIAYAIAMLFLKNDDWSNYIFWFNQLAMKIAAPKTFTKGRIYQLRKAIEVNEKVKPYVVNYYKKLFPNSKIPDKSRKYFIDFIIQDYFERSDIEGLVKFIQLYKRRLKMITPKKLLEVQIKIQIKKGDHVKASKLVEELKAICNKKDLKHFHNTIFNIVTSMKSSTLQIPIDWDEKLIQLEVNKLVENKKASTNRFIRNTLTKKAGQVISTDDPELFIGSLTGYKKIFAPFIKEYSDNLKSYLALLKKAGPMNKTASLQKKALLSLKKVTTPVYNILNEFQDCKSIKLPTDKAKPFPFLNMKMGTTEFEAEKNFTSYSIEKQPPAYVNSLNDLQVFQNYHEVVCLKNNKLKWKFILQNSTPTILASTKSKTKIMFNKVKPVINNGKVFVRLFKDGKMSLFCLDANSGKLLWGLNNSTLETCSEIALWRDRMILIAKENDAPYRYYLLEINPTNGVIYKQTFLYSSEISFKFTRYIRLQADLFLPAPKIIDNNAYISTNNGLILSFNIMTSSFNWIRKYKKTSFFQNTVSHLLVGRSSSSPIVSSNHVLFQPINAASLLLLDKTNGKNIKNLAIDWKDVIPCGRDKVIIIFGKDRLAAFYSLKDMKKLSTLPGNAYRLIQQLSDGVILQSQNNMVIYDFNGKLLKSMVIPENTIPIYVDKNSLFAYNNKNHKHPGIIEKFLIAKPKTIQNSVYSKNLPTLKDFSFKTLGNNYYILSRSNIISLNLNGTAKWIRAIPASTQTRVYQKGNYIYIFTSYIVMCIDKNNGKVLNSFPSYGTKLEEITAETFYEDGTAFVHGSRRDSNVIWMTPTKSDILGQFKGDVAISTFKKGNLIAGWKRWEKEIAFYRKEPKTKDFSNATSILKFTSKMYPQLMKRLENFTLITDFNYLVKINADKKIKQIKLTKGKKGKLRHWEFKSNKLFVNHNFCFFKSHHDLINIVNFKKSKDLGLIPKFHRIPVYINGKMYGLSEKKIVCFDPVSEKIIFQTSPELIKNNVQKIRFMNIFKFDDKVACYFNYYHEWERQSADGVLMVFSLDNPKPEITYFPGAEPNSQFLDTGKAVLISLPTSNKVITLSKQEFNSLKSKNPFVFTTTNAPINHNIDGYPDEWDLKKFHKLGKNSFDIRIIDKKMLLGLEIKDPKLIKQMGKCGIDDRYSFKAAPAALASLKLQPWLMSDKTFFIGLESPLKTSKKLDTEIEYAVKPDGSSCFIEIKVPLKMIMHYPDSHHKKIEAVKWRGDIAFELFFKDNFGNQHALLSSQDIPAFYPRISISSDTWCKW